MEMINKVALRELREAGMADAQAEAVASHIPDWSQFATKQDMADLRQDMSELRQELRQDLSRLEVRIVFWMFGLLVAAGVVDRLLW